MNEDFNADSERPKSRWSVAPGSVSDSFRRPASTEDDRAAEAPAKRRPASEIIAESRAAREPTRTTQRRSAARDIDLRPDDDKGTDAVSRSMPDDELPPTKATPKRPAVPSTRKSGATAKRPTNAPELGDKKELTTPTGIGHSAAAILAGFGGVLLIVITTAVGSVIDFLVSGSIGLFGAIGLGAGAAFAALVTRKRDLLSVLVAPPIVYAVLGLLVLLISSRPINITSIAQLAISGFPAMAIATGLAAVIIGIKLLTTRVGERR